MSAKQMSEKTRGRPRSEKAKQAILNAASTLIDSVGITGLTIEAVASVAQVGKPTIYRYWANAQELAMASLMANTPIRTSIKTSKSALDELGEQLENVIERFAKPSGRQAAILMASADTESELSKAFRTQVILQSREQGRALVMRAIAQKELSNTLPIDTLLDMIYGPIFYRLLVGHEAIDQQLAKELVSTIRKIKRSS